ncbi:MAG: hypothetical protein LAN84_05220 [Acidobacteriia bacterium]|nr:hypothetical protein [Terriglobia bacterium]
MNGTRRLAVAALAAALALTLAGGLFSGARAQETPAKQPYTMAEYNSYTAAASEKTPGQQIKLLDDFAAKYPNSALSNYVYELYYQNYSAQRNYPKAIEYVDKLLGLGDKVDSGMRYKAYYARAFVFNNLNLSDKDPSTKGQAEKARDAAIAGLKTVAEIKKPENVDEKTFAEQKRPATIFFNYTAAAASMLAKDFPSAVQYYKATLELTPNEAVTWFRLGVAYLATAPPQPMDAFWALAHSVALKGPSEAKVRTYLRTQMLNYQQTTCENLADAQMNELVALAGSSAERPASYKMPSAADLEAARKDMTIASVLADLKAGGDKGKVTWLASCGLEFPDVPGKLIEVAPAADGATLKVAFVTSDAEFEAATSANMEVKVAGQPEAARLEKGNPVRFTGTLTSYDPDPAFLMHWEKAKVNAEDIPAEKKAPVKKPVRRPPTKKPAQ